MEFMEIGWEEAAGQCEALAKRIDSAPDVIIGISRGGLVPARILSDVLGVRKVGILGMASYKRMAEKGDEPQITQDLGMDIAGKEVLLVDDISDSGGSLLAAKRYLEGMGAEVRTATIHRRPGTLLVPDYCIAETSAWVIYPWERHEAKREASHP